MKTYDENEKYNVYEDEDFLNHLREENAFAYYLIRNNQKRPYKKSGLYSSKNQGNENKENKIKKFLDNPTVKKTLKRVGSAALSGAVGVIAAKTKARSAQKTREILGSKIKGTGNILSAKYKNGSWRV